MNYAKAIESIKTFLEPFKLEFWDPFVVSWEKIVYKYKLDVFYNENKKGLFIGIAVALLVFLISRTEKFKEIKNIFFPDNSIVDMKAFDTNVAAIMERENIDYESAKDILIANELVEHLRITKDVWVIDDKHTLQSCDKISFKDKDIGLVSGFFLGIISPDLAFYDDIFIMRLKDGSLRYSPISSMEVDSLYVYKNSKYYFKK